jgi:hypothetical protein
MKTPCVEPLPAAVAAAMLPGMMIPARLLCLACVATSFAFAAVSAAGPAVAQDRPVAFMGAEVLPVSGPPIPAGVVVVANGKITAVGPAATTPIPADAERIDAAGKVIMPGLVDTHSHVGGGWGGDASGPMQADVRILDSINVRDSGFRKCRAGGLTTLNIMPGSGHLLRVGKELRPLLRTVATGARRFVEAAGIPALLSIKHDGFIDLRLRGPETLAGDAHGDSPWRLDGGRTPADDRRRRRGVAAGRRLSACESCA